MTTMQELRALGKPSGMAYLRTLGKPTVGQYAQQVASGLVGGAADVVAGIPEGLGIVAETLGSQRMSRTIPQADEGRDTPGLRAAGRFLQEAGQGARMGAGAVAPTTGNVQAEQSFLAGTLPRALGSTAGFVATGAAGRLAGLSELAGAATAGALVNGAAGYQEAKSKGATEEQAWESFLGNLLVGTSEAADVLPILSRVNRESGGALERVLVNGGLQGFQEGGQQAASNLIAQYLYDPERKVLQGVAENGGAGFLTGILFGAMAEAAGRKTPDIRSDEADIRSHPPALGAQEGTSAGHPPTSASESERTYAQEFAQSAGAKLQFKPAAEIAAEGGIEPDKAAKLQGHYDRANGTVTVAEGAPVRPTVFHEVLAHHMRAVRGETFGEMQSALRRADPELWTRARAEAVRRRGEVGAETGHGTADEEATALTIETLDAYVAEAIQKPDLEIKQPHLLHSIAKALVRMLGDLAPKALREYASTPYVRARHQGMAKIVAKAYFELRDSASVGQDAEATPPTPSATAPAGAEGVSVSAPTTQEPAPAPTPPEPVAGAPTTEETHSKLRAMAKVAGWDTEGGKALLSRFADREPGQHRGRAKWVARDPWWEARPEHLRLNETQTKDAVRRYIAGEKLKPKEQRFIDWMIQYEAPPPQGGIDILEASMSESDKERQAIQGEGEAENTPVGDVPFAIKGKRLTMDEKLPTERKVEEKQEEMFGEKPKMVQKQAFDLPDAEVEKPRKQDELFSVAWHGSPYDFDEFKAEKIGTGEGAQAYGHGLYFTDKREIAEHYRRVLAKWGAFKDGKRVELTEREESALAWVEDSIAAQSGAPLDHALTRIQNERRVAEPHGIPEFYDELADIIRRWKREGVEFKQVGRTYQVNLALDDDEYLLWDKPLSEQSEKVKAAVSKIADGGYATSKTETGSEPFGSTLYKRVASRTLGEVEASKRLRALGVRGIKYLAGDGSRAKQEGTYNYVIFDPADVRIEQKFSIKGDSLPDDNWREYVRRSFVDIFRPVTRLGAEQAVRLRPGRVYGELEKIERQFATPLKKAIADAGLTLEQAGEYVTARHAEDRNALILKRSKGKRGHEFDPGSGMRTSEARAILAKGLHPEIDRLVADLVARQRKILVDSGLVSAEAVAKWTEEFGPHYVPLQTVEDPDASYTAGPSLNVTGPKIKRAEGRSTLADNPILVALIRTGEAVQQAERNRVGQAFAKIVEENPSAEWSLVDKRPDGHALSYKVDGEQRWIATSREDIARAFAALDVAKAGPVLKIARKVMSFLRAAITSRNPVFPFYNVPKDIGTAMFKGYLRHDAVFGARIAANALPAARGVWSTVRGAEDGTGKWAVMYRRMRDAGGLIGWKNLDSFDEMAKDWKKTIEGGVHPMRALGQLLDDANRATELGTRLATFEAAAARGMSDADAAALSRDITVDFAKKGNWSQNASLVYLFFNANVQGTESIFRAMAARPAQAAKLAAFLIGMGYAASLASRMFADDDDWELMSESDKQHRFGVMVGDKFIGVPAPWGFNVLWYLGARMEESVNGKAQRSNPAADLFSASLQAFSPLQGANIRQAVAPTLWRPFEEIGQNQDFAGRSIRPEDNPYDKSPKPRSEQFFPSVNPALREATAAMNRATGGNEVRPGAIDVSPEDVEHFLKFVAGGIGSNAMRGITVAQKYAQGEPVRISDWPAIRAYVTQLPESATQRFYYENLTRIEYAVEEKRKIGETADRRALELASLAKNLDRRIKVLKQRGETEKVRALMAEFNTKMMQP